MILEYTHLARISEVFQKDHTAALDYHKKRCQPQMQVPEAAQAELNNKIAGGIITLRKDKEALNYLQQAYEYYEEKEIHKAMAVVLGNKGIVSYKNGKLQWMWRWLFSKESEREKLPALSDEIWYIPELFATHRVKSDSSRANFFLFNTICFATA